MVLYLPGMHSEKIIECVPNFSEGQREDVIKQVIDAIKSVPKVMVLDHQMDPDHNRAVITFLGSPKAVIEAAFQATRTAAELIDLTEHVGEHPRFGATDVIPLVPINQVSIEECVILAEELGKRIADELHIPVYLYEKAAKRPDRQNLANIRNKNRQFEQLRELIKTDPNWKPDFGPRRVHPTAGATIVGARDFLIAYNVNLGTNDVDIAKKIARNVRASGGGLKFVKALGFELKNRGIAQVSMNVVNYEGTPLHRAFELIKIEAERFGVPIIGSEIIGLVPLQALLDATDFYLRLEDFSARQILDLRILETLAENPFNATELKIVDFMKKLGLPESSPAAGSVAALNGAMAAALLEKSCTSILKEKKNIVDIKKLQEYLKRLQTLRDCLTALIDKEVELMQNVAPAMEEARSLTEEGKHIIQGKMSHDYREIIELSRVTAMNCLSILEIAEKIRSVTSDSLSTNVLSGITSAHAGISQSVLIITSYLSLLKDDSYKLTVKKEIEEIKGEARRILDEVLSRS